MSRTTIRISVKDMETATKKVSAVLSSHNYKNIVENNERVWKCGTGFLTAVKYIKAEFSDNEVVISGWIRPVGGKEQDLNGFVGGLPKKQVLNIIKEIQTSLS